MNEISGYVNFPINDPQWKNTNEGGMVVKLVVCDNREDISYVCCGGTITDLMNISLIGDDHRSSYDPLEDYNSWASYHYPRIGEDDVHPLERFLSREYLAVIVLGTTDWSGWNEEKGDYWYCHFEDLTEEGKILYQQIKKLYPGCDIHLLTFLDT